MAFTRPRAAQINFDATNISDSLIRINSAETGDNTNDLGIVFERGNHTNAAIVWDESADAFRFISTTHTGAGSTTDINISGHHNLHVGTLAASSLVLDGTTITATPANFNVLDGLTVTTTELNYVDGVTSNIQTQIDNISSSFTLAADSGTPDTFTTGQTLTIVGGTGIDTTVSDNNISIAIDSTVATQSYVTTQISNLVDSAPTTLDTLNELAAALGDDANFSTTVTNSIATKLPLAGGTMTGAIAMGTSKITGMGDPTAAQDAATKAYVDSQVSSVPTGDITAVNITAGTGLSGTLLTTSGDHTQTLSIDNSTVATLTDTQTLTNKTLTTPIISSISNTGTLTLPTSTDTLVGRATTDTLTNKTLTSPTINAFSGTGNGSITGTLSIVTTTTDDSLLITTTEDSSSAAPVITLKRNSSSVADADYLGQIKFAGENDADQEVIYAKITGKILDASDGTEDGIIEIAHKKAGSNNISARFRSDSLQLINGTQLTVDGTSTFNGVTVNSSQTINMGANAITSVADPSNAQDAATKAYTDSGTQTLTNKTLTSPQVNTNIDLLAQADLRFYDADSSNYVGFQAPATATGNILWTLPGSDGTEGQVLGTNGGGTLTWEDPGSGGGSGSSYPNSTFSTVPGTNGNFDMSYNVAQTTQETAFEAGGTDAFGVNLGSVFSCMDPIGTVESIDYADGEAYVGA